MPKLTPMKAIRAKCRDCCNGQTKEIRLCTVKSALFTGTDTGTDRKMEKLSEKQIQLENLDVGQGFLERRGQCTS